MSARLLYRNNGIDIMNTFTRNVFGDSPYAPKSGCVTHRLSSDALEGKSWKVNVETTCTNPKSNEKDDETVNRDQYPGFGFVSGNRFKDGFFWQIFLKFTCNKLSDMGRATHVNFWSGYPYSSTGLVTGHILGDGTVDFSHEIRDTETRYDFSGVKTNQWHLFSFAWLKGGSLYQWVDGQLAVTARKKDIKETDTLQLIKFGAYTDEISAPFKVNANIFELYRMKGARSTIIGEMQGMALDQFNRYLGSGAPPISPVDPTPDDDCDNLVKEETERCSKLAQQLVEDIR